MGNIYYNSTVVPGETFINSTSVCGAGGSTWFNGNDIDECVTTLPLSITWDTQTADTKASVSGGTLGSLQYTNDGGSTWSTISGTKQTLVTGTGPYELKEVTSGGEVDSCNFDDSIASPNFGGDMTVVNGKIVYCSFMFNNLKNLVTLDVTNFNTSSVTTMRGMFQSCRAITSLDVTNFDTSKVTDMSLLFTTNQALTSVDVSNFDTSSVTTMGGMFNSCSGLTSLDLTPLDTSSVTDMGSMFHVCSGLTSINVSGWDISKVTKMERIFQECSTLTSIDLSSWNIPAANNDASYMFREATSLTHITMFDTSTTIHFDQMFYKATSLTCINQIDTTNATNVANMFLTTTSLVQPDATAQGNIAQTPGIVWAHPTTCP